MAAKVSIRKMGTRRGQPHYGAECMTCHTILVPFGASRETCVEAREKHKIDGCVLTLAWVHNVADAARLKPHG